MKVSSGNDRFATTHWSVVLAAGADSSGVSQRALSQLCGLYWFPVYSYLRRRGEDHATAEDLTQGFFAHMLERKDFARADPERGRFRSYLLTALRHYAANQRAAASAQKRGGDKLLLSLDLERAQQRYAMEPADERTPESMFHRSWAVLVLQKALEGLGCAQRAVGKGEMFERLRPFLTGSVPPNAYKDAAVDLGSTPGAVKVACHRLRRAYGEQLRALIRETVADPGLVDSELRELMEVLGGRF